jgi:hypothetical protein
MTEEERLLASPAAERSQAERDGHRPGSEPQSP